MISLKRSVSEIVGEGEIEGQCDAGDEVACEVLSNEEAAKQLGKPKPARPATKVSSAVVTKVIGAVQGNIDDIHMVTEEERIKDVWMN